jgi:uncharacterized repeat protein (TIGR03803 family)
MKACAVILACGAAAVALTAQTAAVPPAQVPTTLHEFAGKDGKELFAGLVQTTNGELYGTASKGGLYNGGTLFKISTSGSFMIVHDFCQSYNCPDGSEPTAAVTQGLDGSLYGTTYQGGANMSCGPNYGCGTVFKVTDGTLTTLYNFCSLSGCIDGSAPQAPLMQGADGNFYGTTNNGGPNGGGTIFKLTPEGALATIYTFCSQIGCSDGDGPTYALALAANGSLFGTTVVGGANDEGTVFTLAPNGVFTTLHSFDGADGQNPYGGLLLGTDGNFYGTTMAGGGFNYGTVFKITGAGVLTTLYSFTAINGDGASPDGTLIQATDVSFYGTTVAGGDKRGDGTVFSITPGGIFTTVGFFDGRDGGYQPLAGVVQDTNGNLYGTTLGGGAAGFGTIYSLSVGLVPFVKPEPTSGDVGVAVTILGTNLTGTTSVTFNGTAATFTVVSGSEIITTVPTGATTGTVQVVTPTATLSSNVPFTVTP